MHEESLSEQKAEMKLELPGNPSDFVLQVPAQNGFAILDGEGGGGIGLGEREAGEGPRREEKNE